MKDTAEGLAADLPVAPAANEDFGETRGGFDPRACQRTGWDPYEVWRTRVKAPAAKAALTPAGTRAAAQAPQRLEREPLLPEPLY
jgi:hypothetical protein